MLDVRIPFFAEEPLFRSTEEGSIVVFDLTMADWDSSMSFERSRYS